MNVLPEESARDFIDRRLAQLRGLSCLLCGEGGEVFRNYHETIQDNVMWLISDLVEEVIVGVEAMEVKS